MHIEQTQIFSVLSNQIRLRCLYLLATNGEACVCDVVDTLRITQPSASKALSSLKAAGLVRDRREGNWIYYSLRSDAPDWIKTIVSTTISELGDSKTCVADEKRYKRLVARPREIACP